MFKIKTPIESLVNQEIVLTNLKGWSKHGTIFTSNKIDYSFIFRMFDNCIGSIHLEVKESLENLKSNIYILREEKAVGLCHGGKNDYHEKDKPDLRYGKRNEILNKLSRNITNNKKHL